MLETSVGPLSLRNPVLSASGTFGSGWEARTFADMSRVGALVSKTVTVKPRHGNPPPRIHETPAGMLNSIGLENKGVETFLAQALPRMKSLGTRVVINIGGESIDEFKELAERFSAAGIDALEVNLSCPNVQEGRLLFSTEPRLCEQAIAAVKRVATVPVFAKLSPNVTDIVPIARAAEQGGADGITAINTLIGMAIDWRRRKPVLGRGIGGLSGPAIKPVAIRMVHEICKNVRIPVIGVGGAQSAEDVLEFVCAGASAVQVGTAAFADPTVMVRIVDDLAELLASAGTTIAALRGASLPEPQTAEVRQVKLQALDRKTVRLAISIYQGIAYGTAGRPNRAPDLATVDGGDVEALLALFQKELFEPIPGYPCVRYSLRLGNRNYPFMKLVLQEHLVAGEFFFAVNTHDQMEIRPDYPDYESWMTVRRFNRDLKQQIEDAFDKEGLDTAACLRRAVQQRCADPKVGDCRGTVLVVDDEEDLAETIELLLKARGFRVFKVHDGQSAMPAVRELMPDMVLLDYELPELDGLQVIELMRDDTQTCRIPVLLASAAKVSMNDIRRADGFLAKPFQEALLYEMVDRVMKLREVKS